MIKLLVCIAWLTTAVCFGQGDVWFNNYISNEVSARVTLVVDGSGVGAGWTAQLFGGPAGTAIDRLTPLFPTTTFQTSSAAAMGYVNPVNVAVPGVRPGEIAILVMRAYDGRDVSTSAYIGTSPPIIVRLGGDAFPPAHLIGLQPIVILPEPSSIGFALVTAALILCRPRRK
jgi:hypothetical protein